MKRTGLMCMALLWSLALGALGAASASAASPELVNREGKEVVKKHVEGTVGEVSIQAAKSEVSAKCKEGSLTGTVTGLSTHEFKVTLHGCGAFGSKCNTPGAESGEAAIGWIVKLVNLPKEGIALLTSPLGETILLDCPTDKRSLRVRGSFLVPLSPIGKLSNVYNLVAKQSGGVQEPTEYEGEKGEILKNTLEVEVVNEKTGEVEVPKTQAGLSGEEKLTFEEEVEFRL